MATETITNVSWRPGGSQPQMVNWNSGPVAGEWDYECPKCGATFSSATAYALHVMFCKGDKVAEAETAQPQMVVGFPDLDEADVDAIFAKSQALDAEEDSDEYNWGWTAWEIGLTSDHLDGLALQGWLDAEEAYAEERSTERQLFTQTVARFDGGAVWGG